MARVPRLESYKRASCLALRRLLAKASPSSSKFGERVRQHARPRPGGDVTRFGGALRLEYRGNWKMFMENAVDLVHPTFVHKRAG